MSITLVFIYLMAITIGVLVTVVPIMNGANTQILGTLKVSFYHYVSAFLTGLVAWFLYDHSLTVSGLSGVPIQYYFGGILGLSVILLMNHYAIRIKAIHVAILPFLGQMVMGLLLDYWLFQIFNVKMIIGLLIVLCGLYIQSKE